MPIRGKSHVRDGVRTLCGRLLFPKMILVPSLRIASCFECIRIGMFRVEWELSKQPCQHKRKRREYDGGKAFCLVCKEQIPW